MPKKIALYVLLLAVAGLVPCLAQTNPPFTQCPAIGADTSCAILITIGTNGSLRVAADPAQGPFDGVEDTLIGVQNNSSHTILSIPLSGPSAIFAFDGDGLCSPSISPQPAGCPFGPTGYEGPGVTFASSSNQMSGVVSFIGGIPPGHSAYFSLEEQIQISCPAISGVPLLKQALLPWGPHQYDGSALNLTIAQYGCAMTDIAMIINFWASQQGSAFRTNPDALNTYLRTHQGYYPNGGVIPTEAMKYAISNGLSFSFLGFVSHRDDFTLDSYICSGQPVLLYVGNPHWVVATGRTTAGGVDTYSVNDPAGNNTSLQGYGNTYNAIALFTGANFSPSGLYFFAHSPVELLVTDPSGKRTGIDPRTGSSFDEIPAGSYEVQQLNDDTNPINGVPTPPTKVFNAVNPLSGIYLVEAIGTGNGPYTLDFYAYDDNGTLSTATFTGTAGAATSFRYQATYSSVAGSQIRVVPRGTTPPGDLNWDGKVDCQDLGIVKASFGKKTGQVGFDSRADLNRDGVVNVSDLSMVARQLPAGTKCP
jgi:hypothetical protein